MSKSPVPKTHPRYHSLLLREKIIDGYHSGITGINGLLAHGRGEAFDYLIEEKTQDFAEEALCAAAKMLIQAHHPVLSINGNVAALCPKEMADLANTLECPLEINIFYSDGKDGRAQKIKKNLEKNNANCVLLPDQNCSIGFIDSHRKYVNPEGIKKADVVLVPLEDGDRTQALVKNKIKVITVDLNPLSRTAKDADINIVDNIYRCIPKLIDKIKELEMLQLNNPEKFQEKLGKNLFDKEENRQKALKKIKSSV